MKNYKLIISYDGTNFHGFQIQKDKTTVQGEFQKALEIFTEKYELNYSGRTDSGVHAKAQVINIKTELAINYKTINSLNKILGSKISINSFKTVKDSFHARYDAFERTYKYFVSDINHQYPYLSSQSYIYPKKLDLKKLNYVAELFVGEHNFSSFSKHDVNKNPNGCYSVESKFKAGEKVKPDIDQRMYGKNPVVMVFKTSNRSTRLNC